MNRQWILDQKIRTVIDVGANEGQFARLAREVFREARIYSFEPLADCFKKLQKALPQDDKFFPFKCGIGSKDGKFEFFRSFHTPSSSFLKMEDLHREVFPESVDGQRSEPTIVDVKPLDGVFEWEEFREKIFS